MSLLALGQSVLCHMSAPKHTSTVEYFSKSPIKGYKKPTQIQGPKIAELTRISIKFW